MDKETHEVLLRGCVGKDGLYEFPHLLSQSASSGSSIFSQLPSVNNVVAAQHVATAPPSCSNLNTWHLRLGHPNPHTLKLVLQHCKIPFSNKTTLDFCADCCVSKSHRLPSHSSTTIYSSPLEIVCSDLWGPAPIPSTNNFLHYITFIDAYSRFTWIYLLKNKSEAFTVFKQFKSLAETQYNAKIKSLQTDWGGEFRPFTKFLTDLDSCD